MSFFTGRQKNQVHNNSIFFQVWNKHDFRKIQISSTDKGQLISKGLFGVINSCKKRTKKQNKTA